MASQSELATLGGGCFWCLEAVFERVRGVQAVVSGYSGGHVENPDYRAVCEGRTGHAEVVRIRFDPDLIRFEQLLELFFAIHDPTTLNRQGHDIGTQYRSVIFCHSERQKDIANTLIDRLNKEELWDSQVVTAVCPEAPFFPAEEYHQQYFKRNPDQGYCQIVVAPKVAKLRQSYAHLLSRHPD